MRLGYGNALRRPARKGRARIETCQHLHGAAASCGRPARKGRARIETVMIAQAFVWRSDARPARVGRGLKRLPYTDAEQVCQRRPARKGRARIETLALTTSFLASRGRPARKGRARIETSQLAVPNWYCCDARPARVGRGLKLAELPVLEWPN